MGWHIGPTPQSKNNLRCESTALTPNIPVYLFCHTFTITVRKFIWTLGFFVTVVMNIRTRREHRARPTAGRVYSGGRGAGGGKRDAPGGGRAGVSIGRDQPSDGHMRAGVGRGGGKRDAPGGDRASVEGLVVPSDGVWTVPRTARGEAEAGARVGGRTGISVTSAGGFAACGRKGNGTKMTRNKRVRCL